MESQHIRLRASRPVEPPYHTGKLDDGGVTPNLDDGDAEAGIGVVLVVLPNVVVRQERFAGVPGDLRDALDDLPHRVGVLLDTIVAREGIHNCQADFRVFRLRP